MAFSDAPQCTATAKSTGERCQLPAIKGTTVCRVHGGKGVKFGENNPAYETGRYSGYLPARIQAKADVFKQGDPLNIFDELASQRALFVDYAERFDEGIPLTGQDVDRLMAMLSEIMKSVERIVKIRNDTALTGAEVAHLQMRAVDVAMKYFANDPDKQERFLADLFGQAADTKDLSGRVELIEATAGD